MLLDTAKPRMKKVADKAHHMPVSMGLNRIIKSAARSTAAARKPTSRPCHAG
jgi:hypothetical protein